MRLLPSNARLYLEQILRCKVVQTQYLRVDSQSSYKVKIHKADLWFALNSQHNTLLTVRLWKKPPHLSHAQSQTLPQAHLLSCHSSAPLSITTWNCRGLGSSEPHLRQLSYSSDIILLQEHWLWPLEVHKLSSIIPEFSASGRAENRLSEQYNHTKGCGGVAILWKKSSNINPLHTVSTSDRICPVEFQLHNSEGINKLVVYNIYCPSSDYSSDQYEQSIHDLEEEINSHSNETTAIVIAGDFNAHLGTLSGCRSSGPPNHRGIFLKNLLTETTYL